MDINTLLIWRQRHIYRKILALNYSRYVIFFYVAYFHLFLQQHYYSILGYPNDGGSQKIDRYQILQGPVSYQGQPLKSENATGAGNNFERLLNLQKKYTTAIQMKDFVNNADKIFPQYSQPVDNCRALTSSQFRRTSLVTKDLVITNSEEEHCYLMKIRGFIKLSNNEYIPFRNFEDRYPLTLVEKLDAKKIKNSTINNKFSNKKGGSSFCASQLEGNVTAELDDGTTIMIENDIFHDDITVKFDCGYLVFQVVGDSTRVALNKISMYWSSRDFINRYASQINDSVKRSQLLKSNISINIFSTNSSCEHPLLAMPVDSRYQCMNRIIFFSQTYNSKIVQLYLERFELQRLETNNDKHQVFLSSIDEQKQHQQSQAIIPIINNNLSSATNLFQQFQPQTVLSPPELQSLSMSKREATTLQPRQLPQQLQSITNNVTKEQQQAVDPVSGFTSLSNDERIDENLTSYGPISSSFSSLLNQAYQQQQATAGIRAIRGVHLTTCPALAGNSTYLTTMMDATKLDEVMWKVQAWKTFESSSAIRLDLQTWNIVASLVVIIIVARSYFTTFMFVVLL